MAVRQRLPGRASKSFPLSYGISPGISVSTYPITHTYAGPGTYTLTTSLANRTTAINITNSATQQEPLTLLTTFTTTSTPNQTPILSIPATGFSVALNQQLVLPLHATDADGDSLTYSLAKPQTSPENNLCSYRPVTNYQFPNDITHQGTFKINNRTGDLIWNAPTQQGTYSMAIAVNEYRNGILLSQTLQEITLIVEDRAGTPTPIPPYEPAIQGDGVITATASYPDTDFLLTAFPNPADDNVQVVIQTSNPTTATIELFDITGRKLHELQFRKMARQHEQVISLGSLTPGTYLLHATVGGRILVRKIVKR